MQKPRKFWTSVRASTGAYFAAYVMYPRVYLAYIKAWKQLTALKAGGRVLCSRRYSYSYSFYYATLGDQ